MLTGHIMNSTCLMMPKHGILSMFFDAFSSKKDSWKIHINSYGQSCCIIFPCCYFTGKEKDEETGYGYFGARYMDHELMTMWLSVDPMSDKYPSISPYAYCAWNPVKLVDPDGRQWKDSVDARTADEMKTSVKQRISDIESSINNCQYAINKRLLKGKKIEKQEALLSELQNQKILLEDFLEGLDQIEKTQNVIFCYTTP